MLKESLRKVIICHHVLVAESDAAAIGAHEAREHHEKRRLARSRRPEQGDELAARHLNAHVAERLQGAVRLGQAPNR